MTAQARGTAGLRRSIALLAIIALACASRKAGPPPGAAPEASAGGAPAADAAGAPAEGTPAAGAAAAAPAAAAAAPPRASASAVADAAASAPGAAEYAPAVPARPPASAEEAAIARQLFSEALRLVQEADAGPAPLARAADMFDRAFDMDPALVYAGVNAGILRERLGDEDGALAVYARVLDDSPWFAPAARSLVRLRIRRGDVAGAEKDARDRLARYPPTAALHDALAEALLAAGRLDGAEQEARKALKLDEKNVPAMVSLATVYHRKKRHELAKMVLDNARQVDDRDPTVWNRLGFVDLALGNRAQALEDFRTAAALGPDFAEARANYGAFLADAEDYAGAVAELEAAVRLAPRRALAWLGLGNACRGAQQFDRAEAAYRKARELDPALREVDFNLAVLYLDGDKPGTPALARLEQAVAFFEAFEKAGGGDPKLAEHRKDAAKAIDREKKRLAREERDRLRREAEARKKEEEARKEAEAAAAAAAKKAAEEEAARRAAEEEAARKAAAAQPQAPTPGSALTPAATGAPAAAPEPGATPTATSAPTPTPTATPTATPKGEERGDR
ncbi:MAG TPA: tetratricopeptide repeat protein [Anaeromyxobacter sp.]|nr:tetratricopeptide repeat protein [Anaeromyxobacter sp.]